MSAPAAEYGRFQCCWYGWRAWRRFFFQRYEAPTAMRYIYRWRIAIGPLDIRRWSTLQAPARSAP